MRPVAGGTGLVRAGRVPWLAPGLAFALLLGAAGLPALYTAVLARHDVGAAGRYAYVALYIVGHIADDTLMVTIAVLALGQRKLTERAGRWLQLASSVVMLLLGAVLALRPHWLM